MGDCLSKTRTHLAVVSYKNLTKIFNPKVQITFLFDTNTWLYLKKHYTIYI